MLKLKRVIIVLMIMFCVMIFNANADGPRSLIKGFFGSGEKVSADPKAEYPLDETNGPWMIYVKSYNGPNACDDARTLALELRQKHGMKAYVHHKKFDYAKSLEQEDESKRIELEIRQALVQAGMADTPLSMPRYASEKTKFVNGSVTDEYAVLVGDFQSIDDKDINKTFEKIKNLEPECIIAQLKRDIALAEQTGGGFAKTTMIELQRFSIREYGKNSVRPLEMAIKCPNPVLPTEYFSNRVDDFVQKLNADSRYSLLRCPGKHTIKVAEYRGFVIADPKGIEEAAKNESKLHQSEQLARAGDKAETVCHALREKGYEAYTFHDRTRSIVTVGSFNTLGKTDRNGDVVEFHPEIADIFATFTWNPKMVPISGGKFLVDQEVRRSAPDEPFLPGNSIMNIPLLPVPEPMDVPKTFANYNRR
ncbi:MAG: hypothetical protein FWH27_05080 [Planctomycetaceae bacterium]|nr:hypothetical protein [Planctomycetaceae bacterium]